MRTTLTKVTGRVRAAVRRMAERLRGWQERLVRWVRERVRLGRTARS